MTRSRIIGTGSFVPQRILSNNELERIVETNDEWITRRTGIKERRIASKGKRESTTDLATQAAENALRMAGVNAEDLDMIVVGTVTPDRQFPSTGCMLQTAIGASQAAAFDVSAGCSGFLYGLTMADNAIRAGTSRCALVVGAERLSTIVNWQDRSTCVLLGDGAGAVVMAGSTNGSGVLSTHLRSDGAFWDLLYASYESCYLPESLACIDLKPFQLKMEGNRLFKRAVNCLSTIAEKALAENGLASSDIHLMIPHQANIRIILSMAQTIGIPMEKVYTNLDRYGNTSSASIPIALDEANRAGLIKDGDMLLLVSFGAGLTWGASIIKWGSHNHNEHGRPLLQSGTDLEI
ncbi:beta-ketoacyl-ACP synthase III [Desulfatiglans anilini]|uniref:beta-ketoacyl-ACP synthase III n=1 Tax=Desulfatiglans anilini TaxID=90728 RepID=UPI0004159DC0|nr:beta-ketoacyl-ACP synthase III [Desulfatiglans anilini]